MQNTHIKKMIAGTVSAAMVLSSISVFAVDDGLPVSFEGLDTYLNLGMDKTIELPDEEVSETANNSVSEEVSLPDDISQEDSIIPEETAEPETITVPETADNSPLPDITVWDIPDPLDWNEDLSMPVELNANIASGKCGTNLTWTLDSEGTLTISGKGAMKDYYGEKADGSDTEPWYKYKDSVKKLVLNNGITSIGGGAFASDYSGLTGNLVIPDSVTSIGSYAFYGCNGFTGNLVIPDGVTSIEANVFYGCSGFTGNLVIPESVTAIYTQAFENCSGLTGNLVIPDGVTSIGNSAFSGCRGLTGNLVIPNGVTSIGTQAFFGCNGLTGKLVIPDGVTSIGINTFAGCSGLTGNLVIPDGVTSIGSGAFTNCRGLTGNLVIPNGVTSIGTQAFFGCNGLTGKLVIPDGVTSIGINAFGSCSDCKDTYSVGDTVNVCINEIEYDEKGHAISIQVSGKMAEIPDFLTRINNLSSGTRCMGRITSIRPSKKIPGKTVILLYLEDFNLPAIAMYTQIDTIVKPLQTGDKVVFSVFDTKDNGYVKGSIIQRT